MKVIIIGNGIAGVMTAGNLRQLEPDKDKLQIEIYTREPFLYYARLRLPEIFGLNRIIDEIRVFKEDWYESKHINVNYGVNVSEIIPGKKEIVFENGGRAVYDKLVLSCGADSMLPDIPNNKLKGIFRIREYKDAVSLKDHIKTFKDSAVVIGGGLLGLETARFMKHVRDITVIEMYPRLLPRQLDDEGASLLKAMIEDFGIKIMLNVRTAGFNGNEYLEGLSLDDKTSLKTQTAVISVGIVPRVELAKKSGLLTNRGIVADQFLRTSDPDIYIAGDIAEFEGVVMGIIPAAMEHAKVVSQNIIFDNRLKYTQIIPKTSLKISGIDLVSIGKVVLNPEEHDQYEIISKMDMNKKTYFKFVLKDGQLAGSIIIGDKTKLKWAEINAGKIVDKKDIPI